MAKSARRTSAKSSLIYNCQRRRRRQYAPRQTDRRVISVMDLATDTADTDSLTHHTHTDQRQWASTSHAARGRDDKLVLTPGGTCRSDYPSRNFNYVHFPSTVYDDLHYITFKFRTSPTCQFSSKSGALRWRQNDYI